MSFTSKIMKKLKKYTDIREDKISYNGKKCIKT